jgi:hypothetical protein
VLLFDPDLVEIAEMAESMEEFRVSPLEDSAWAAATGPAMAGDTGEFEPVPGFEVIGSETVRNPFGLPV